MMEVEKVIELFGKPTPNTEDLFHALHVENQTQRSRNSHRFLSPQKINVAPVATPHKHHKQVECSPSGRSSRAPETNSTRLVKLKERCDKERPGVEMLLGDREGFQ